ncbi:MAG TPA: 3-ketoacyl-ACP reductase [Tepidisphaeraceae bacterium]|jgi:3-oxoacyl-[acyl-carrier protein] reductase|nr:3-ketoacyl-ACP reductase [Tepidisphaeraceae bacterium]
MAQHRKVALVTGGSRGIGLGVAKALAASGFDLAISGRREPAQVAGVLVELQAAGAKAIYFSNDVAELSGHAKLLDEIRHAYDRLDVLVNNAGVAPLVRADILEATPESFDRLIGINLRGPYFLTQAVARRMIEQRKLEANFRGCIVNVSSVSAAAASTNRGDYCISKAGVAMATQLWAVRLAEFGIDVYEVRPGIIATDMTAGVKEKYDAMIAAGLTVERRWGLPADVGKAVAMLARGELPYATGQVLLVDGGMSLKRL